jgi:hypothetical protein
LIALLQLGVEQGVLALAEAAEVAGEAQLLLLGDFLAAEDQHDMVVPGLADGGHRLGRQFLGQIDAADLRAAGGGQRRDLHGLQNGGHGLLPRKRRLNNETMYRFFLMGMI